MTEMAAMSATFRNTGYSFQSDGKSKLSGLPRWQIQINQQQCALLVQCRLQQITAALLTYIIFRQTQREPPILE